jgi:hypothetical protein
LALADLTPVRPERIFVEKKEGPWHAERRQGVNCAVLFDIRKDFRMMPARFAPVLFGFILSGLMSAMVSGIATWRALGIDAGFAENWFWAWLTSWAIAFPAVLVVAPIARRLVALLVRE